MNPNKFLFYIHNPKEVAIRALSKFAHCIRDDKKYLILKWKLLNFYGGDKLNLEHPETFNEKLNWLKLYNRKAIYTQMADKYLAKGYVERIIGKKYVVKLYGVYDSYEKINFDLLPQKFVIKCTHDSGSMIICKDKSSLDKKKVKAKIEKALKTNYFYKSREWPYKNIIPRILIEEYLDDHVGNELCDYKFWCFNGIPRVVYFTNKSDKIYENFYDIYFKPLDISHGFPRHEPEFTRPNNFEEMIKLATKLSKDIPFVRVDFFNVDSKIYFAEFTFYDWGGFKPFSNKEWDVKLGSWIKLPE